MSSDEEKEGVEETEGEKLKIVSWNINGMKTFNIPDTLKMLNAQVVIVQETKLTRLQMDQGQVIPDGYSSYFSFCNNRIGYSGVANFCKNTWTPAKAEEGLCWRNRDLEDTLGCYPEVAESDEDYVKIANVDGRTVLTQHLVELPDGTRKPLSIINVYCPRHRDDPDDPVNNTNYKAAFHQILHQRAYLLWKSGSFVVLGGDFNISHKYADTRGEGPPETFVVTEFRQLLTDLVDAGFVDSYRSLHPSTTSAYTCWNTRLNARENNYGSRIDYIFVDKDLSSYIASAEIHPEILGSDHCPISVTFKSLKPVASQNLPAFATKFFPEFKGKQVSLLRFVAPGLKPQESKKRPSSDEISSKESKKRPLSGEISSKQPSKRVQTSISNFFQTKTPPIKPSPPPPLEEPLTFPKSQNTQANSAWKEILKPPQVPLCSGHKLACVRRTTKKKGVNFGRDFWSCPKGAAAPGDPNGTCNFFQWVNNATIKKST